MIWNQIKYFKKEEWVKDPTKVDEKLIKVLDDIRNSTVDFVSPHGVPIIIHVAWDNSGHAPNSYHYKGKAVDFHFGGSEMSYFEQFILISQFREIGGIGFYPDWNHIGWHIDIRERNPRLLWYREDGKYFYGLTNILDVIIKTDGIRK